MSSRGVKPTLMYINEVSALREIHYLLFHNEKTLDFSRKLMDKGPVGSYNYIRNTYAEYKKKKRYIKPTTDKRLTEATQALGILLGR